MSSCRHGRLRLVEIHNRLYIPSMEYPTDRWLNLLDPARILRWLLRPRVRLAVAWIVAVVVAWNTFHIGWTCMATPMRRDYNNAHVNIDFSGQYLLGRMIVKGEGPHLYRKEAQKPVLKEVFPESREEPELQYIAGGAGYVGYKVAYPESGESVDQKPHDWEDIQTWMIGDDEKGIKGPLYPPVHALLFAPLAMLPPLTAYRVMQVLTFMLTFVVAFLAERITDERIWCPVAIVGVMITPGYMGALGLGQNPLLTLTLLMTGWWLVTTQRPVLGGIAWGFLAYKPVWAVAFLPVLLVTGRWKASAAMIATGILLALATLPVVGVDCWIDWYHMGRLASDRYSWDENWLVLSRDLINLPRRPFITHDHDTHMPTYLLDKRLLDQLSYRLWCDVMAVSLGVALLRRRQVSAATGPGPAFLLLAGWMSCLHFMYYDVLLTFLPLCVLFSEPRRFLQVSFWLPPAGEMSPEVREYYQPTLNQPPPLPLLPGGNTSRWVINPLPLLLYPLMLILVPLLNWHDPNYRFPPVDTYCILGLWAWCGWTVWRERTNEAEWGRLFTNLTASFTRSRGEAAALLPSPPAAAPGTIAGPSDALKGPN
jgi:arabinofuranan 3-O-arabinosyltransferase